MQSAVCLLPIELSKKYGADGILSETEINYQVFDKRLLERFLNAITRIASNDRTPSD